MANGTRRADVARVASFDVELQEPDSVMEALQKIFGAIRTRILGTAWWSSPQLRPMIPLSDSSAMDLSGYKAASNSLSPGGNFSG